MNQFGQNIIVSVSTKRKSIAITVHPDLTVRVIVPKKTTEDTIRKILNQKQNWIDTKLEYFRNAKHVTSRFASIKNCQSFYYIGDKITIHAIHSKSKDIVLKDNILTVYSHTGTANTLNKWIESRANILLSERLAICFTVFAKKFSYNPPQLKIRRMKRRWGSMSKSGVMVLNLCLVSVPIECIDYVIMHELCHMKYHNHGTKFHKLQEYFTPNYKEIKKRLDEFILT